MHPVLFHLLIEVIHSPFAPTSQVSAIQGFLSRLEGNYDLSAYQVWQVIV